MLGWSMFVNCTSPESSCGSNDGAFLNAGSGVCNVATEICECRSPEYGGRDLWQTWNDCHVHAPTKDGIEYLTTALILICGVSSGLGVLRLLVLWGIVYWRNPEEFATSPESDEAAANSPRPGIVVSNDSVPLNSDAAATMSPSPVKRRNTLQALLPAVDIAELQSPRTNARTNSFQQMVAERKRRRNTLILILNNGAFAVAALVFQVHRHLGIQVEEARPAMLLSMALAVTFILFGLWMLTYTWYSNLPSLRLFAAMFPNIKDNILVKHPHALRNFMILNCILTAATSLVFFFILPVVDKAYIGIPLARVTFSVLGAEIFVFTMTHAMVCVVLLRLFKVFNVAPVTQNSNAKARFSDGELTVRVMLVLTSSAGPFFVIWCYLMAFYPMWYRYYFFFVSALLFGGSVTGIVVNYIFVFRMGSKTRVRKESTSQSPKPIQSKKSIKSLGDQLKPVAE